MIDNSNYSIKYTKQVSTSFSHLDLACLSKTCPKATPALSWLCASSHCCASAFILPEQYFLHTGPQSFQCSSANCPLFHRSPISGALLPADFTISAEDTWSCWVLVHPPNTCIHGMLCIQMFAFLNYVQSVQFAARDLYSEPSDYGSSCWLWTQYL